ncbi:MAG TPA: hypothetical protein ENI94_06725 [Gammaproteobacteria bacterium]|nr:hypothetical protein [Gammaproteobacteria bacterium]
MTAYPQLDRYQHPLTDRARRLLPDQADTRAAVRTLSAVIQGLDSLGRPDNPGNVLISLRNPARLIRQCPALRNGRVFEARLWLKQVAAWDKPVRTRRMEPLIRLLSMPIHVPDGTQRKGLHR